VSEPNTLALKVGSRLRTGGTTYEVTESAHIPAGVVPVVPQVARLLKVFCEACGYTARITQRWITKAGTPQCPCGHGFMTVAVKAEKTPAAAAKSEPAAPPVPVVPVEEWTQDEVETSLVAEALAELPEPAATDDSDDDSGSALAELLATL
jgi:hypothetical protein